MDRTTAPTGTQLRPVRRNIGSCSHVVCVETHRHRVDDLLEWGRDPFESSRDFLESVYAHRIIRRSRSGRQEHAAHGPLHRPRPPGYTGAGRPGQGRRRRSLFRVRRMGQRDHGGVAGAGPGCCGRTGRRGGPGQGLRLPQSRRQAARQRKHPVRDRLQHQVVHRHGARHARRRWHHRVGPSRWSSTCPTSVFTTRWRPRR